MMLAIRLSVLALLAGCPGFALAQGCPPDGGTVYPKIEEMNQLLLDGEFDGFSKGIKAATGGAMDLDLSGVAKAFPRGLTSCTTILQREDAGGMTQHFVIFRSPVGPLFVYWRLVPMPGRIGLHSVSLKTDIDALLEDLK